MCLIHEAKLAISSELVLFHLTQQVLNVIILIIICTIHKLPSSKHAQNDTGRPDTSEGRTAGQGSS